MKIKAWLETVHGNRIPVQEVCSFGREPGNTVILTTPAVSRRHAVIHEKDDEFWMVDLGSTNGVLVNQQRVIEPVRLQPGDRIEMPSALFTFRLAARPVPGAAPMAEETAASLAEQKKPVILEPLPEPTESAPEQPPEQPAGPGVRPETTPVRGAVGVPKEPLPPPEGRAQPRERIRSGSRWLIGLAAGLVLAGVGYYFGVVAPAGQGPRVEIPLPRTAQQEAPQPRAPSIAPVAVKPWTNSLGMPFVPAGTPDVLFGIWDVRVKDFQAYVEATHAQPAAGIFVTKAITHADGSPALGFELDPSASWNNPGFDLDQGSTDPVVGVSWDEAMAFCQWLTKKEQAEGELAANRQYRLPTDAEWSRAAGKGKYPWGDAWPPPAEAGNYGDQALASSLPGTGWASLMLPGNDGYSRTSPVGSFRPNAYGLYDMGGNVWQWCDDWYQAAMNSAEALQKLPGLRNDGGGHACKVLRGASWNDYNPEFLLSSCRSFDNPDVRYADRGFRVVVAPSP